MRFEDLEQYDYSLPPELIRRKGIEPRDSARLFVYDTKADEIYHDTFSNLAQYLPEQSLLVLNETRVVPARLWLKKETGGKIEVFVLVNEWEGDPKLIPVLVDRKCAPGMKLFFPDGSLFEVVRQEEKRFFVRLEGAKTLDILLDVFGETPVPHYLEGEKKESENDLRKRYQTVFATSGASVAAPTASLHFTDHVFGSLDTRGIECAKITLDVGLGTFAPLCPENFETGKLHRERFEISAETVNKLGALLGSRTSKSGRRTMVAVGTTALRTLESVSLGSLASKSGRAGYSGVTDIFIFPPHRFHSADMLITNFHLPKTSLMLLVDAFLEHKGAKRRIVELYHKAIEDRYAFYSFGDSMLIR